MKRKKCRDRKILDKTVIIPELLAEHVSNRRNLEMGHVFLNKGVPFNNYLLLSTSIDEKCTEREYQDSELSEKCANLE